MQTFADQLLRAGGASAEEATVLARSLVDANLCGYDSHGVMRIPFYLDMLAAGDIVSEAPLTVVDSGPSHVVADAAWGFGRVQMGRLLDRVTTLARESGVGIGTLRQSSHIGRLGEYCELAGDAGLVSMLMVNTHGAARRVAPPGGIAPRLGTNPLAMGVPDNDETLVLDFSTSATAEGKVRVKWIAGEPCPPGWLLDARGQPTTDPATLYADPPGSILPMGGTQTYKGFGLALMIDLFAGALSGGLCAREVPESPKGNCVFLMLLEPDRFGGRDHFKAEVRQTIDFLRNCPTAEGVDRIRLPGDPEREAREQRRRDGITLDGENWDKLAARADLLGVPVPEVA